MKLKGYRIVCAEDIFIHHFGQGAFKKLIETGEYLKIWEKNQEMFERKWGVEWETHKTWPAKENFTSTDNAIKKTKEHWGQQAGTWKLGRGIFWLEHEEVQKRINKKVSGVPNKSPNQYLIEFMSKRGYKFPLERCLTLGCGSGALERDLSQFNFCLSHDAFDISDKAIGKAIAAAKDNNLVHIDYQVQDINEIHLLSNTYDVIFGVGSVHHFMKLEHIFHNVNKALKPDGIFFLNEYVGPSRFQWTDRQLEVINSILKILPKKYKRVITDTSVYKELYNRPTVKEVTAVDPSEAFRSAEIVPLLNKYFDVLKIKEIGGSILHSLLTNIAGNFKINREIDMMFLEAIFNLEDILMKYGDLSSDFVVIIAKKHTG